MNLPRRTFIKGSAAATAAIAAPSVLAAKTPSKTGPNGRLRIGFIGVGGRAQTHLDSAINEYQKLAGPWINGVDPAAG